jgi:hypothetical protein
MSPAQNANRGGILAVFALPLLGVLVPVAGYCVNSYVLVPTLFYADYQHSVWVFSAVAFRALAVASLFATGLTLFHPRWLPGALRSSRLSCAAFAVWLAVLAYVVKIEGAYLGNRISDSEARVTQQLFQTLHLGLPTDAVLALRASIDKNIVYSFADSSPYRDVAGYPYLNPQPVIVLALPGFSTRTKVVVEMSGVPSMVGSEAVQISMISDRELIDTKPAVPWIANKIYKGYISLSSVADSFVSCDGSAFRVVLDADTRQEHFQCWRSRQCGVRALQRGYRCSELCAR